MSNSTLNCYQPNFTVLNDFQVLVDISGGVITRLEARETSMLPTYLAIRHDGRTVYFYDAISDQIHVYEPVSMALFHQCCDSFCPSDLQI